MLEGDVMDLARHAIFVSLQLTMPILMLTLIIGVIISLFQAVTQIQEQTLTFVPKILVFVASIVVLGPWMLHTAVTFMSASFLSLPSATPSGHYFGPQ